MVNSDCDIKRTTPLELPPTFSNRELSLLIPELSRKKAWQIMTRLEKSGIVRRVTSKPTDYWSIVDENRKYFFEEIERALQ